jgi:membrane protein DedA with SNARE-associated domain
VESVFDWVANYGAGTLFLLLTLGIVGLPIPEETLLVFSGYLIFKGALNPVETLAAGVLGSWCGISMSYWIGRTVGLGVVHRFGKRLHLGDENLDRAHRWFDRKGHWALFGGYYVVGVRHLTAIVAGASRLDFTEFMLYAWSGGFGWVVSFLALGYFVGEDWRRIAGLVDRYLVYLSIVLVAIVFLYWLLVRRKERTSE